MLEERASDRCTSGTVIARLQCGRRTKKLKLCSDVCRIVPGLRRGVIWPPARPGLPMSSGMFALFVPRVLFLDASLTVSVEGWRSFETSSMSFCRAGLSRGLLPSSRES